MTAEIHNELLDLTEHIFKSILDIYLNTILDKVVMHTNSYGDLNSGQETWTTLIGMS